jgi:hypothetical protein
MSAMDDAIAALTTQVRGEHFHRGAPVRSEQAVPAVRIKTLFNLALNRVGEFAARALKIACDLAVDLLQSPTRPSHQPHAATARASIAVLLVRQERLELRRDGGGNNLTEPWHALRSKYLDPGARTGRTICFVFHEVGWQGFLWQVRNQIHAM